MSVASNPLLWITTFPPFLKLLLGPTTIFGAIELSRTWCSPALCLRHHGGNRNRNRPCLVPQRIARPIRWIRLYIVWGNNHYITLSISPLSIPNPYTSVAKIILGSCSPLLGRSKSSFTRALSSSAMSAKYGLIQRSLLAG